MLCLLPTVLSTYLSHFSLHMMNPHTEIIPLTTRSITISSNDFWSSAAVTSQRYLAVSDRVALVITNVAGALIAALFSKSPMGQKTFSQKILNGANVTENVWYVTWDLLVKIHITWSVIRYLFPFNSRSGCRNGVYQTRQLNLCGTKKRSVRRTVTCERLLAFAVLVLTVELIGPWRVVGCPQHHC